MRAVSAVYNGWTRARSLRHEPATQDRHLQAARGLAVPRRLRTVLGPVPGGGAGGGVSLLRDVERPGARERGAHAGYATCGHASLCRGHPIGRPPRAAGFGETFIGGAGHAVVPSRIAGECEL